MTDRIPPHNTEFEQALLGSLILAPKSQIWEFVSKYPDGEKFFYDLRHAIYYRAILNLANARKPVEVITLISELETGGKQITAEDRSYVIALPDAAPSGASMPYYAEALEELYHQRRLIESCTRICQKAFERERNSLEFAEKEILGIRRSDTHDHEITIKDLAAQVIEQISDALLNKGKLRGVPTGFPTLDKKLRGLKPGQMFVIGARPSHGKTALAINIVEKVGVDLGMSCGVFSLEMTKDELFKRLLCSRAEVTSDELDNGNVTEVEQERLKKAIGEISRSPIHIQDPSGITVHILAARARWMAHKHDIKVLVIDYLQLLHGSRTQNRTVEMTEVSNAIKCLAKELGIPIIVLAQLNRESEKEGSREPRLSDLRDSGSIEQDADIVALLNPEGNLEGSNIETTLLLRKHRNGPTGKIPLLFRRSITKFEEKAV